jgi:hypothetical protein
VVGGGVLDADLRGRVCIPQTSSSGMPLVLDDVLVIPGNSKTLISMGRLESQGNTVLVRDGLMTFFNEKTKCVVATAKRGKDFLYHLMPKPTKEVENTFHSILKGRDYVSRPCDEVETPKSILDGAISILNQAGFKGKTIYEPFFCTGASGKAYKDGNFGVLHTKQNFHDPLGPVPGDYDILVTNGPYSDTKSLLRRLRHEPAYMVLLMADTIGRNMFELYDSNLIFIQQGLKFTKPGGENYTTTHPNTFVWVCKGLDLPSKTLYMNKEGKLSNFYQLSPNWQKKTTQSKASCQRFTCDLFV